MMWVALPETNSWHVKTDGLEDEIYLLGKGLSLGANSLLVSGRVTTMIWGGGAFKKLLIEDTPKKDPKMDLKHR